MSNVETIERIIKVIPTDGGRVIPISTSATTWEEFKSEIRNHNISTNNIIGVNGMTDVEYKLGTAKLPNEPFTIMLMAEKIDSGASDYARLRAEVKSLVDMNDEAAAFFNNGRNYTNRSTEDLRQKLHEWNSNHATAVSSNTPQTTDDMKVNAVNKLTVIKNMVLTYENEDLIVSKIDELILELSGNINEDALLLAKAKRLRYENKRFK